MAQGPLDEVTVVDFTRFRAGPWCTQILSELGAEVIKVERPHRGDPARAAHPERNGMGVNFIARNRNKKSLAVNLKHQQGQELVERLIAEADVVVENYSLGVMERFGLGYDYLTEEVNPDIVYASVKGYGEHGPFKDRKGVDLVMQAEGGMMSVTGPAGGPPVKVGQAIGDIGAGLYAVIGVLTALYHREREGGGQKFETNLFGTIVSFLEEYITMYGVTGDDPAPLGTRHQTHVPYELFETADGQMVFSVGDDEAWERFVQEVLEEPRLLAYDSVRFRQENYDEIMAVLRPVMRERTTAEWQRVFDDLGLPNGPYHSVSEVIEHPQAQARGYVFQFDDDHLGEVLLHGHPIHFSDLETGVHSGPPRLGEHTQEVLADRLGLTPAEITDLQNEQVVQ